MRIGNWLGGAMVGAIVAAGSVSPASAAAGAAERVRSVPLGDSLMSQAGDRHFGVYIPTRFGGALTVRASSGTIEALTGPDGKPRTNGGEVGDNQQGWYTFKVTGAKSPYAVETAFVQVAKSARKPWNFYYWPTKADSVHEPWSGGNGVANTSRNPSSDDIQVIPVGQYAAPGTDVVMAGPNGLLETAPVAGDTSTWFPNQFDDLTFRGADGTMYATPAPMLKYDQIFNSTARGWEAANSQNQDIQRWPGHCLGGAVASIMLNEPTPPAGMDLTRDELKALWAELGENHLNHQIGDHANDIPPGPPRLGWDDTDSHVPRVHAMLERHIRGEKKALLANLRAFPPRGTRTEVWNHGVGEYTAKYHSIPGKGERSVRLEVEVVANSGSCLNGEENKPRVVNFEYTLVYGLNGEVDESNPSTSDWIAVRGEAMFAPLNILEIAGSRWAGHNPYITESNVRSIDLANGGNSLGRLASNRPNFRPVGNYEAGRPAFAMGNNRTGDSPDSPSPRRGGLFRMFGR